MTEEEKAKEYLDEISGNSLGSPINAAYSGFIAGYNEAMRCQSSPKIKQLQWRYDEEFFIWEANSVFGKYFVKAGKNEGALMVDANKAAAQADFQKRIKECLA